MIILRDGYFLDFFSRSEACYPPQIESQTEAVGPEIQLDHVVCNYPAFPFHAALMARSGKSVGQVVSCRFRNRIVCYPHQEGREYEF